MNMAESRHYPVPKPRQSQKPFPGSKTGLTVCSNSSNISSSPPSTRPLIKPKPKGYKTLEFNNKGLVSIAKDIDIGDTPVNSSAITTANENMENNNNVTSVKDFVLGNVDGNSVATTSVRPRNVAELYKKPLPPTPGDTVNKNINNLIVADGDLPKKASDNIGNQRTPPLPTKPTRIRLSASELQVQAKSTELAGMNNSLSPASATDLRGNRGTASGCNPILPRKPTNLCRQSDMREQPLAALKSGSRPVSLPGRPDFKTNDNAIISGAQGKQVPQNSRLSAPEIVVPNGRSLVGLPSNKGKWDKDIGHTPPLPRKTGRNLSPGLKMHLQSARGENSAEEQLLSVDGSEQKPEESGGHGNKDGKRLTSVGSPSGDRTQRTSPRQHATKGAASPMSENKFSYPGGSTELSVKQDASNSHSNNQIPEGYSNADKQGDGQGSAPLSKRVEPPQRAPPPLPHEKKTPLPFEKTPCSPTRRPPPGLPKQPSLDRKKKSLPPPLPEVRRPMSVIANKMESVPQKILRAKSADNMMENDNSAYWVAYQHNMMPPQENKSEYEYPDQEIVKGFMDSVKRKSEHLRCSKETTEKNDGGYESLDEDVVKKFVERKTELSSRKDQSKEKLEPVKQAKITESNNTYSSSSDDSDHEYVEPDDTPAPRKEELLSPTLSTTSDGSHSYIEPVHTEEEYVKPTTETSKSLNNKFVFKPYEDMDGDWSAPKVIDWEYDGESDDSDASYVEPDVDEEIFDVGAEEPLYQIYQANMLEKERTLSLKRGKKGSNSEFSRVSQNVNLRSGTLGAKMLWCQLPEVRNSGLLDNIAGEQRKIQEAIYEVISSEVSYLKSLNLLVDHFLNAFSVDSFDSILDKNQFSELFLNIKEVVEISESFLDDLRKRKRQSIVMESISDIITEHATNHFGAYVAYCSCQYKQDRMLSHLKKNDYRFAEALEKLEHDSRVVGLTLQSFLVLPMQRVTRFPLLVDAIVRRCEPGRDEYYKTDEALKAVNQVVYKCNEGARNEERREEMIQIEKVIAFLKMKPIPLATNDRWLLRRGPLQLLEFDSKISLSNTLRRLRKYRYKTIYLFLFNDLLVVTKKKSETLYSVIDFANRNLIRVQERKSRGAKNSFVLVLLENLDKKTKELHVRAETETEMTRWREAFRPPEAELDDEKIYGTWDCPQVHALHNYQAQQSDELTLVLGDVVNVIRKLPDGWYEGERIRDCVCGWFPANHTEEIRNEHVRARNLHQRYRLLAASTAYLDKRKR